MQDAAGAEVFLLDGGVEAHDEGQLEGFAAGGLHQQGGSAAGGHIVVEPDDGEAYILEALHSVIICRVGEVEGQHAHADEVAAVDALEALGDNGLDTQQVGALGGPVAAGAHAVVLAANDDGGYTVLHVGHAGIVDEGGCAAGGIDGGIRGADGGITEV